MKQKVKIEDVLENIRFRKKINGMKFENIEWTRHDMPVLFTDEEKKQHIYSGLNNVDFVSMRYIVTK